MNAMESEITFEFGGEPKAIFRRDAHVSFHHSNGGGDAVEFD